MSTPEIQSALNQIQRLAGDAASGVGGAQPPGAGGFADELRASLARVNQLQQHAAGQARAFQTGEPGVSLPEVMVDSQKASVAFQMGVQVRNRLITAYKDIMNMQV